MWQAGVGDPCGAKAMKCFLIGELMDTRVQASVCFLSALCLVPHFPHPWLARPCLLSFFSQGSLSKRRVVS